VPSKSAQFNFAFFIPNELDSGGFKRKLHGLNGSRRHDSLVSLESDDGLNCKPRGSRKPCLCPIKQPSGGSALRGGHFRLPFAFLSRTLGPPPFSAMNSMPAFSNAARTFSIVASLTVASSISMRRIVSTATSQSFAASL
jgi:hypothetical protein